MLTTRTTAPQLLLCSDNVGTQAEGHCGAERGEVRCDLRRPPRDDDGRIAAYLAGRRLPAELAQHLRLARLDNGRSALAAFAGSANETLAVQVLALDADGKPQTDAAGKKVRRTFASVRGWAATSAWHLAAVAGADANEIALVEGVEDALALRTAGWSGAIAAVLGKGQPGEARTGISACPAGAGR